MVQIHSPDHSFTEDMGYLSVRLVTEH